MFCYQCEQTAQGSGCTVSGVCGKNPETAALQDLLNYAVKGIGWYAHRMAQLDVHDEEIGLFVVRALFSTITNVDFDPDRLEELIYRAAEVKEKARLLLKEANGSNPEEKIPGAATWEPAGDREGLLEQAEKVGLLADPEKAEDLRSLEHLLLFGLKGLSAYTDHAHILGEDSDEVYDFIFKALSALAEGTRGADELTALNLECGKVNITAMELLSQGHRKHFGVPEPTPVFLGTKKGPAIIVSGHDLLDLEELLQQTEGRGVNIYTHGEMLPAHGYPGLKKYKHLVGNFGSAWQNQQKEFDNVPAAVLMTTNCIQKPRDTYQDRIFTTGLVAWPGLTHIPDRDGGKKDFSAVIAKAKEFGGFEDTDGKSLTVGFAHETVLGVADKVIDAVKSGAVKHFFLIGGCDGAKPGRNYYTELAELTPKDTIILTLACGKYRFNKLDLGEIGGIPRLLDVGQCNDAYSAVKIAQTLAEAFECGVNELPLSLVLSWYEQKAVVILLSLLYLGIENIRLGPTLPAFVSPGVLNVLVEKFAIKPISSPAEDLKAILGS